MCAVLKPGCEIDFDNVFRVGDALIPCVSSMRYLGVQLSGQLGSFTSLQHRQAAAKAKRLIGVLHSKLSGCSTDIFCSIYTAKVLPVLAYGLAAVGPSNASDWHQLERVHRFAARLVTKDFVSDYSMLLRNLNWTSMKYECYRRQLRLVHNYVHGFRHMPFHFTFVQRRRQLRVRAHDMLIDLPAVNDYCVIRDLPICAGIELFNHLPCQFFHTTHHPVHYGSKVFEKFIAMPEVYNATVNCVPVYAKAPY
jgi:hypothetical protein